MQQELTVTDVKHTVLTKQSSVAAHIYINDPKWANQEWTAVITMIECLPQTKLCGHTSRLRIVYVRPAASHPDSNRH